MKRQIISELESLKSKNRYRTLSFPNGLDFSSNDYLCLSQNRELKKSFKEGIELFGTGSTASRLIRGHRDVFERTEAIFADWVKSENSLFVANGYAANSGLIDCLSDSRTIIFTDRLNHASILDGIRISGAIKKYYRHRDTGHLAELLRKSDPSAKKIIVSESVFSMDGDICALSDLVKLKREYDATLIIDEAHALGIFGIQGGGISLDENRLDPSLIPEIDFRVFTAGKSLGLEGAFIATTSLSKEYLVNKMRTFIFSTAPIPAIAHTIQTSIALIKKMDPERQILLANAFYLRNALREKEMETLQTESQIIPVVLFDEIKALEKSARLKRDGFDIRAIRPPTVQDSRLRISINSEITRENLDALINVI
ncbi:MAG: 8-amino-7-oxononanoate synthase [Leptospira sp.]|nr:8-amino-7-oxononanoate synthase [Leptospira sp.]